MIGQKESITFEVEKGLRRPYSGFNYFFKKNVNDICPSLFQREKKNENLQNESNFGYYKRNDIEPLKVLHYDFDTEKTELYSHGKTSLTDGLLEAYKNHYPITVSPDMIWILFLQGYSRFMEKYAEFVRSKYVNFEGQKKLTVEVLNINHINWKYVIDEFVQKIKENVGESIISNLESNFTTTNSITLTTSQVAIMSGMKRYFKYEVVASSCGISFIILEGTVEDWKKIKSKLEFLSKKEFALGWWIKHLIPIIDKIISTKLYYHRNGEINEDIRNFWKNILRIKSDGGAYNPTVIDGWIVKFIPNLTEEFPKVYDSLDIKDIPDQILHCPIKLKGYSKDFSKKGVFNCSLASGFYGMSQDEKAFAVKPVIGYAIIVESEEASNITKEEKESIIDQFFS